MRRLLLIPILVLALVVSGSAASAGNSAMKYPAYHRVQRGESMWGIARHFLERATGDEPASLLTSNEVRQMRRLNKDTLHGSDRIYAGQRLLLAPSIWDVPDGKDGWGTGFTYCTNEGRTIDGSTPRPGLTLHVRLLKPPVDKRTEQIRFVIHNSSDRTRKFSTQQEHGLLVSADGSVTAVVHSDAIGVREWTVRPGATVHVDGPLQSFVCGDTRYLDRPLPAGRYQMYGVAIWGRPRGGDSGQWLSPTREVRVVRN